MKPLLRGVSYLILVMLLLLSEETLGYPAVQVTLPDTCADSDAVVTLPVTVDDVSGKEIYSAEVVLTFDGSILEADSAYTTGTITQGWGPPIFNYSAGQISIAMAGISPLSGSGPLVYVVFHVTGSTNDTTTIHFDEMQFNEGDPSSSCRDGLFTVGCEPSPVCEVSPTSFDFDTVCVGQYFDTTFTITNTGGGILSGAVSEACADYSLLGDVTYSLTAEQSDTFAVRFEPQSSGPKNCTIETDNDICSDVNCSGEGDEPECEVSPTSLDFDTVCVGEYSDTTFTITNTGGCTLSGEVTESCNDFSLVGSTNYSLDAGESYTFTVRFEPQSPGPKSCTIETGNDICGDVSCSGEVPYYPVQVTLPDTCAESGNTVAVPIYVDDITGKEIYSAEIDLVYDGSILEGDCDLTTTQGTIAEDWGDPTCNSSSGSISIAMAGVSPLSGSGVLVYVGFIVNGPPCDTTNIHFDQMQFNEGNPPSACQDGLFTVTCPQQIIQAWVPDTVTGQKGESISIPVKVGDVTGREIYAAQCTLRFENNILSCDSATTIGTIAEAWGPPTYNCFDDTAMVIAMAGVSALADSGDLVYACFTAIGCPSDSTTLDLEITLNEGDPPVSCQDGFFVVDSMIPPTNCSATPSCSSITVTWTDNSNCEDGFYIYKDGVLLDSVGPNESIYVDDFPDTVKNCYTITAFIVGCDESEASDSSCTTALRTPRSPTGLITVPGSDLILVSWENVDDETGYYVYRNCDLLDSVLADSTNYVDPSPPIDSFTHVHCYTISATNNCGESNVSESACDSLYQIKGKVQDTASAPVADFAIYVMTLSGDRSADINDTTYTDSDGNYKFKLPTGNYQVYRESAQYTIDLPVDIVLDALGKDFMVHVTDGDTIVTDVEDLSEGRDLPDHYFLSQNYPNPFNPETRIQFSLPQASFVTIDIYNILGQRIRALVNERLSPGYKIVTWDGRDDNGLSVSTGVYLYRIAADNFAESKKMLLLK